MEGTIQLEDAFVVAAVRAGNIDAFSDVIARYQAPILRYLLRLTGDRILAEDLAQDTFLQAYQSILKTRSDLQIKPWLYRIATNNALQHRRRSRLLSFISFEEWRKPHRGEPMTGDSPDILAVQQALNGLPADYRVCLVLHYVEGFKYQEIGLMIGISEEAVRKRIARGKVAFRRVFHGGEE